MIKSLIVRIVSAVSRVLERNQLVASSGEYDMHHVLLLHSVTDLFVYSTSWLCSMLGGLYKEGLHHWMKTIVLTKNQYLMSCKHTTSVVILKMLPIVNEYCNTKFTSTTFLTHLTSSSCHRPPLPSFSSPSQDTHD